MHIHSILTNIYKKITSSGLNYVNDIKDIDDEFILDTIQTSTHFSFSFIILLVVSSIVSTLGLLLNNTAVIIGGMIISPLMWPLMKISIGITYERKLLIRHAISLLLLSILISLISAYLIATISPLKHLNNEIITRTTPTILDIFVALSAGIIAAMALIQKKISSSLAGVAIATSLMPPLCVAGIGLSLYSFDTFSGGFLLFMANVVSIIFSSILVFLMVGVKKNRGIYLQAKGILTTAIALIITAVPLAISLKNYTFKINAYDKTSQILIQEFNQISPDIYVQNITTNLESQNNPNRISISADLLIPEKVTINFQQKATIINHLESALNKKIDLNLHIQKNINLESADDQLQGQTKTQITQALRDQITKIGNTINIDTIDINYQSSTQTWIVNLLIISDPTTQFSQNTLSQIELTLSQTIDAPVNLNVDIIPRMQFKSQPDLESEQITKDIRDSLRIKYPQIDIQAINITKEPLSSNLETNAPSQTLINLDLRIPQDLNFPTNNIDQIKSQLDEKYNQNFQFQVNIVQKTVFNTGN